MEIITDIWLLDADLGDRIARLQWLAYRGGDREFILRFLQVLAIADIELARMATSLTWLADEVNRGERQALGDLKRMASKDLELAKLTVSLPWYTAGVNMDTLRALEDLERMASKDLELAKLTASAPWLTGDLTSNKLDSLTSLMLIAENDPELARLIADFPWFADDRDRKLHSYVLNELANMTIFEPNTIAQLITKPWFADGLNDHEAAFVVTLSASTSDTKLYEDLLQAHFVQTRTISLPLKGDVNIWVIQNAPFPSDDELLTVVEDTARISEGFMKVPFPTTDIVVLVVVLDDDSPYYIGGPQHYGTLMVLRRYKEGRVRNVQHETAHYYSVGPVWFSEGGANFILSYFNDQTGVQDLADRATELVSGLGHCIEGSDSLENIWHLIHIYGDDRTGCHYAMGENYLLNVFMTVGEEAMSSALRELYLLDREHDRTGDSGQGRRATDEAIYDAFLKHAPTDRKEAFRDLYRRLHGGPYVYPETNSSDDHGDEATAATAIAVGEVMEGVLDYALDFDYFRFQAQEGQKYRMNVDHETLHLTSVTLYAPDGLTQELGKWKFRRRVSSGPQILWVAPRSGEYYFAVQNFGGKTGPYTLAITTADEVDDHGDRPANATAVSAGEIVEGYLDDDFDYDFFQFQAAKGQKYRAVATNAKSFRFTLYLSDGVTSTDYDDVSMWVYHEQDSTSELLGDRRIIEWVASSSEEYYLAVEDLEGEVGVYTLTITQVAH